MDRRRYLRLGAGVVPSVALAGCSASNLAGSSDSVSSDSGGAGRTDTSGGAGKSAGRGVYVQPFREGMYVVGMGGMGGSSRMGMNASGTNGTNGSGGTEVNSSGRMSGTNGTAAMPVAGDYRFALLYAAPHVFWTVNGTETQRTAIEEGDSLHLMSVVWDPKTGTVIPETGMSVELTKNGELVSEETIYPMLSQRMGFHYGGNFALPGDGTYTAKLTVGGTTIRRTGAFEGRFAEPATVEIRFPFTAATREQVASPEAERAGEPGAVKPMDTNAIPSAVAPTGAQLPGEFIGRAKSDDAEFLISHVPADESPLENGEPYLTVSARTPYNRLLLPAMALSATLSRGGTTVFEGALKRTLDPDLGYHYGATLNGIQSGDTLVLSVETPPQVARHEGYEEAFLDMPEMTIEL